MHSINHIQTGMDVCVRAQKQIWVQNLLGTSFFLFFSFFPFLSVFYFIFMNSETMQRKVAGTNCSLESHFQHWLFRWHLHLPWPFSAIKPNRIRTLLLFPETNIILRAMICKYNSKPKTKRLSLNCVSFIKPENLKEIKYITA